MTEEDYLQVIHYKTAKLFEAAAQIGAIISQSTPEVEDSLARYGMHLGTAFQLIDDVLDYSGDHAQTGKHLGDDLAEGKPTLPLIYAMQSRNAASRPASSAARSSMAACRSSSRCSPPSAIPARSTTRAVRLLLESQRAMEAVASLPHSSYRDSLLQLAAFAVSRTY